MLWNTKTSFDLRYKSYYFHPSLDKVKKPAEKTQIFMLLCKKQHKVLCPLSVPSDQSDLSISQYCSGTCFMTFNVTINS